MSVRVYRNVCRVYFVLLLTVLLNVLIYVIFYKGDDCNQHYFVKIFDNNGIFQKLFIYLPLRTMEFPGDNKSQNWEILGRGVLD